MSETLNKQAQSSFALNPQDELNDLRMSEKALPLLNKVKTFIRDVVEPMSEEFHRLGEGNPDIWSYAPGQLEVLESAKDKAKAAGLWNFFLPNAETGEGLSNLDYAYIAVELVKNRLASETMNCAAPDTGNMEVLERVGTPEQKKKWLEPLLEGKIRSAFAMTEVNAASSDAKNVNTRATLNGASASAGLVRLSTSSPIAVSFSAIASAVASVSRCCFSQSSENFMRRPRPRASARRARGSRNA